MPRDTFDQSQTDTGDNVGMKIGSLHVTSLILGDAPHVPFGVLSHTNSGIKSFGLRAAVRIEDTIDTDVKDLDITGNFDQAVVILGSRNVTVKGVRLVMEQPQARFDRLLKAMTEGEPPNAGKKPSGDQASTAARDACSSDTQTPPDTSGDASR